MKKFKSKNIIIYILSFAASAIGIGLSFFLARVLEAKAYGRIQYLVALATTVSQLLIFGLNTFLIREAKNERQKGEVVNKCFSLYLMIVIFFLPIVFYVLSHYIPNVQNNTIMTAAVLTTAVLMGFNSLISAYFQGSGKYHLSIIFENLLPKLFLLITAVIFMVLGQIYSFQEKYLLFYIIFYSLVAIPFTFILFRKIKINFATSELKSICFFFGVTVTYSLGNNLTKVLQGGLYQDDVALGIISVSITIINLVTVITSVLDNLIKPIFAKKKRNGDIEGLLDTYRFDTRMNSYISIPMYLFFILNPSHFLAIFGDSYLVYPWILSIVAGANAINAITGPNGTLLAMTGKEKWELFNGLLFFATYIASIFIFSFDTIYGLCFALLASQVVVNIAKYVEVWLIYKKTPLNRNTLLTILIIIVVNFGAIFGMRYLYLSTWPWLAIGIAVGLALLVLNFFVLSLYRKKDFKYLLNLKL